MATADEITLSPWEVNDDGDIENSGDKQGYFGLLIAAEGVGLTVTGIILWSKGAKKYKNYQQSEKSLSFGPTKNGSGLRFRF